MGGEGGGGGDGSKGVASVVTVTRPPTAAGTAAAVFAALNRSHIRKISFDDSRLCVAEIALLLFPLLEAFFRHITWFAGGLLVV